MTAVVHTVIPHPGYYPINKRCVKYPAAHLICRLQLLIRQPLKSAYFSCNSFSFEFSSSADDEVK